MADTGTYFHSKRELYVGIGVILFCSLVPVAMYAWPITLGEIILFFGAILLALPLAYLVVRLLKATSQQQFNEFLYFIFSSWGPAMIYSQFDPEFQYVGFDKVIYLLLVPLILNLIIYLIWRTSILGFIVRFIRNLS